MKELFSEDKFVPDTMYIKVLQVVSDEPNCKIGNVINRFLPEYGECDVRSRISQLILRKYLIESYSNREVFLTLAEKGRGLLQKSAT
ncbi:MAG: hypothetical protein WCK53_12890 [Methanomicrobiales archaeon]